VQQAGDFALVNSDINGRLFFEGGGECCFINNRQYYVGCFL